MTYDQVTAKVGRALGVDPLFVRLTSTTPAPTYRRRCPSSTAGTTRCSRCSPPSRRRRTRSSTKLSMRPLLESKKSLKISWHNAATEEVKVVNLVLNKNSTVAEAMAALVNQLAADRRRRAAAAAAQCAAAAAAAAGTADGGVQPPHLQDLWRARGDRADQRPVLDDPRRGDRAGGAPRRRRRQADPRAPLLPRAAHEHDAQLWRPLPADDRRRRDDGERARADPGEARRHRRRDRQLEVRHCSFGRVEYLEDDEIVRTRFRNANWTTTSASSTRRIPIGVCARASTAAISE